MVRTRFSRCTPVATCATVQAVRGRYGTFEAYFEAEHGLDARGLAALRNMYLE